jgi:hypothetical protein
VEDYYDDSYAVAAPKPLGYLGVLVLLNVLNIADVVLTMRALAGGNAVEGNPLMAPLIAFNPVLAYGFKIVLVLLWTAYCWHTRDRGYHTPAYIVTGVYVLLFVWHLVGIAFLWG